MKQTDTNFDQIENKQNGTRKALFIGSFLLVILVALLLYDQITSTVVNDTSHDTQTIGGVTGEDIINTQHFEQNLN